MKKKEIESVRDCKSGPENVCITTGVMTAIINP